MVSKRFTEWEAGDFARHFREAARGTDVEDFRERFGGLAEELEPLDREFLRETAACAVGLGRMMAQMQEIAAREGYCERERGFQGECSDLYGRVEEAAASVKELRERCFV